jgi:hypothetical protein
MAQPSTETITCLNEYTGFVSQLVSASAATYWYRGCGKASYELKPALYRHPAKTSGPDLVQLEKDIMTRFRERSAPYLARELSDGWEWAFLMQHFALPTRLLDWTENPLVALYFALASAPVEHSKAGPTYREEAAVWVMMPGEWNAKSLSNVSNPGAILSKDDTGLNGYKPGDVWNKNPVAMYGTHNSARIVAQRGVFTIFGTETLPMERIYDTDGYPPDSLRRLVVPSDAISALLTSLVRIGITDSVVFPDLDGLAKETKRFFGFEV